MPSNPTLDPELLAVFETMGGGDDAAGLESFHDPFFSLDPSSATLVTRAQLGAALPMRRQLFAAVGARGTTLRDIDVDPLDADHAVVRTAWQVGFDDDSAAPLTLESSYLVRRFEDGWRVLVYLNHHDLPSLLADRLAGPQRSTGSVTQ